MLVLRFPRAHRDGQHGRAGASAAREMSVSLALLEVDYHELRQRTRKVPSSC
jgi:hypothetical protein